MKHDETLPVFCAVVLALPGWRFVSYGDFATFIHPTRRCIVSLRRRGKGAGQVRLSHTWYGQVLTTEVWDDTAPHRLWVWLRNHEVPGVKIPKIVRAA